MLFPFAALSDELEMHYFVSYPGGDDVELWYPITSFADLWQVTIDLLPGLTIKQFTAVDVVRRWKVQGIYSRATSAAAQRWPWRRSWPR